MPTLPQLKLLADPLRLRLLRLLDEEELSVGELQQLLGMGQSRISTQLAQLRKGALVKTDRRGKSTHYRLAQAGRELRGLVREATAGLPGAEADLTALDWIRRRRADRARAYFDQLAGRFGRNFVPGRSWKSLAEALLTLVEPGLVIADLGAGEATLAQLLAPRARRVIAVDLSEKMVEYGRQLAREHGLANLDYLQGDLEDPPLEPASIDLLLLSQALHHAANPSRALDAGWRALRPGGRILILDLLAHRFEQARELYGDTHLGFSETELHRWLAEAGFTELRVQVVDRQDEPPRFQTLLATGLKP